jgi:outer membrane receptor protein involved in Fe transport
MRRRDRVSDLYDVPQLFALVLTRKSLPLRLQFGSGREPLSYIRFMKRSILIMTIVGCCCPTSVLSAQTSDTLKPQVSIDLEEVMVVASPKDYRKLRAQPVAGTALGEAEMHVHGVTNLKRLNGFVPNLFTPDYGSRMTSATYIRGIGSRVNTPAVGLYVDRIPFVEKSGFDFDYNEVEAVEVLRGPQSTLYGRNAMGGLVRVYTKNPFNYRGTHLRMGAASYGGYNLSLTRYQQLSDRFAFSAGGFYRHEDGIWRNGYVPNGKSEGRLMDGNDMLGARLRAVYLPSDNLKIDFTGSYEYLDQGGYPYFNSEGQISVNDPSSYRRNLVNSGLTVEYQAPRFTLNAVTGYQYLADRMQLDQDFTAHDLFTLGQRQYINTLSEEIALKSRPNARWQWTTGVFGFYQWLDTNAPVDFKKEGLTTLIEDNVNAIFPTSPMAPQMHLTINSDNLGIADSFRTPSYNVAVYHQSTFNDFLTSGLSLTLGLRLDYEKMYIDYASGSTPLDFTFAFSMARPPISLSDQMTSSALLQGDTSQDYTHLLPKMALQYEWKSGNNVYASLSRGYRSGGYNVQMFSDFVQYALRNDMKRALMESEVFSSMAATIGAMMPEYAVDPKVESVYKPEYSWNYELGTHLTSSDGRLRADASVFYITLTDQQISRFVESGAGRVTVNAGESRSYGVELSTQAQLTDALNLRLAYGWTKAQFTNYTDTIADIDYKDHYIPFAPQHTLNVGAQYTIPIRRAILDDIQLNLDYNAAGRIYWTEANDVSQPFYGTVNARIALRKGKGEVALWANNIFDTDYRTFYFETMGNGFYQKGRPVMVGADLRLRF